MSDHVERVAASFLDLHLPRALTAALDHALVRAYGTGTETAMPEDHARPLRVLRRQRHRVLSAAFINVANRFNLPNTGMRTAGIVIAQSGRLSLSRLSDLTAKPLLGARSLRRRQLAATNAWLERLGQRSFTFCNVNEAYGNQLFVLVNTERMSDEFGRCRIELVVPTSDARGILYREPMTSFNARHWPECTQPDHAWPRLRSRPAAKAHGLLDS